MVTPQDQWLSFPKDQCLRSNSHDWKRCLLKEGHHTIYISNHLILDFYYLWTTSYDRSLLNWTTRAKSKKKLLGEWFVWTRKSFLFSLSCLCFMLLFKWKHICLVFNKTCWTFKIKHCPCSTSTARLCFLKSVCAQLFTWYEKWFIKQKMVSTIATSLRYKQCVF